MAEEERLTKRERRAQARAERKEEQTEQRKHQLRRQMTTGLVSIVVLAFLGFVLFQAFAGGGDAIAEEITLQASAVEEAREAAGCEIVAQGTEFDRTHYEPGGAPPPEVIYQVRPPVAGPHFAQPHPVVRAGTDTQLDEIQTTHNLEHGAVIAWYDPEAIEDGTASEIESWSERLNDSGFANVRGGAGIFASPYEEPGLPDGDAVAFRSWGVGMNCDEWNETVANSFVLQYYGTHGIAPEAPALGPFPDGTIAWEGEPLPTGFEGAAREEPRMDETTSPAETASPAETGAPTETDTGTPTTEATE